MTRRYTFDVDPSTYGLPAAKLAALTGVHIDTARRWKRAGSLPALCAALVSLKLRGELGALSDAWAGFTLRNDQLWTPEGYGVRPGDIRAIPYRAGELSELRRALREPQQWSLL